MTDQKTCIICSRSEICHHWQCLLNSLPGLDEDQIKTLSENASEDCDQYKRIKIVTVYPTSCRECPHCQEEGSENSYRGIYYVCYESDPTGSKGIEIKGNEWELQSWCKLKDFKEVAK